MDGLFIFDTEGDGLAGKSIAPEDHITKFHCLLFKEYKVDNWILFIDLKHPEAEEAKQFVTKKGENLRIKDLSEFNKWVVSEPRAIGCQNLEGFDMKAFNHILGTTYTKLPYETINGKKIRVFDTLSMSRGLWPDRTLPRGCPSKVKDPKGGKAKTVGSHSLQAWGFKLKNLKVEIEDWKGLPLWKYCDRVWEDVIINELQYTALIKEMSEGKDKGVNWRKALKHNLEADHLMALQEEQGVVFDEKGAWELLHKIDAMMEGIASEVEPRLPLKDVPESRIPNFPKDPFDKSGNIGCHGWNYARKILGYNLNEEYFEFKAPPKTAFKKDGSISTHGFNYCKKMGITEELDMPSFIRSQREKSFTIKPLDTDQEVKLRGQLENKFMPESFLKEPMTLSNQEDIKKWLVVEGGWRPTLFNTKDVTRDSNKQNRQEFEISEDVWSYIQEKKESIYLPFISEEMGVNLKKINSKNHPDFSKVLKKARFLVTSAKLKDERGDLCPNLERINGDMAKSIVKWLSLRNRRAVIKSLDDKKTTGWLNHPRLKVDGKLPARYSGLTNTNRRKHSIIANIPSTGALLGHEMRGLFGVPEGFWQIGVDGSNLEGMCAAEAAYDFDGGAYYKSLSGDPHCYTGDVEILTEGRGWVRFDELLDSDHVAQYSANGDVSFTPTSEVVRMDFEGDMYNFSSQDIDLDVSFNHRMVVKDVRSPREVKVVEARKYSTSNGSLRNVSGGKLNNGYSEEHHKIKLLVACQADGSFTDSGTARFSFRKERKIGQIKHLVKYFNGTMSVDNKGDFRVSIPKAAKLLEGLLDKDKNFTQELLKWDVKSRELFLTEITKWDGWTCKGNGFYSQVNKRHASVDIVHTIANLTGRKVHVVFIDENKLRGLGKVSKRVTFSLTEDKKKTRSCLSVKKTKYTYNGKIYCVTVPTGMILVKRNDKIVVSGNTTNAQAYSKASGTEVSRQGGKGITYGIMYGAQAAKIASMLGVSKDVGQKVIDAFWDTNYGLKGRKEYLEEFWISTGKKYILGVDGRKIWTRSQHSLLNCYLQSAGAIGMDLAGIIWHNKCVEEGLLDKGVARTIYYHDEYQMQVPDKLMRWKKFDTGVANKEVVDNIILDLKDAKKNKKSGKNFLSHKDIGELYNLTESDVSNIEKAKESADNLEIEGFLLSGNTFTFEDGSIGRNYCRAGVLMVEAIEEAYKELGFRVPISGEYLSGTSWSTCH